MSVPLYRLYLLRALYLLIAVGQGTLQWPGLIHHEVAWGTWEGFSRCMLGTLALVCVLGLRYPLQMLPVLMFEFVWKSIWMLSVALPVIAAHRVDAEMSQNIFAVMMGVVLCPIVIPWNYLFAKYFTDPGDRWK